MVLEASDLSLRDSDPEKALCTLLRAQQDGLDRLAVTSEVVDHLYEVRAACASTP